MGEVIIGVRFKKTGKLYYFNPGKYIFRIGDNVIGKTDRGEEIGRVVKVLDKKAVSNDIYVSNYIRPAGRKDLERQKLNEKLVKEALDFCKKEAKKQKLNMKVLSADCTLDNSKLTIYFISEERVDFRELVKALASKYKARIELRQIGPRDEVKEFPSLGMCGKEVCCRTFLQDFESVTIKMAKEQGLQINMSKLSGACGKLMCCLKYEEEAYHENLAKLPKIGTTVEVKSNKERGKVYSVDILGLKVKVKFGETKEDEYFETYSVNDIIWKNK